MEDISSQDRFGTERRYVAQLAEGAEEPAFALMPLSQYADREHIEARAQEHAEAVIARLFPDGRVMSADMITGGVRHEIWQKSIENARRLQRFHVDGRLRPELKNYFDKVYEAWNSAQEAEAAQA